MTNQHRVGGEFRRTKRSKRHRRAFGAAAIAQSWLGHAPKAPKAVRRSGHGAPVLTRRGPPACDTSEAKEIPPPGVCPALLPKRHKTMVGRRYSRPDADRAGAIKRHRRRPYRLRNNEDVAPRFQLLSSASPPSWRVTAPTLYRPQYHRGRSARPSASPKDIAKWAAVAAI
jgi:hypothetical protein